jgi:hypothetical protein
MDFEVKRDSPYNELIIRHENIVASTGLLDKKESIDIARELIYTAEQLLPAGTEDIEDQLRLAREKL